MFAESRCLQDVAPLWTSSSDKYSYNLSIDWSSSNNLIILFECFIKNKIEIQSKSSSACLSSSNKLSAPIVKNTCVHKVVLLLRLLQSFYLSELWRFVTSWIEALFFFSPIISLNIAETFFFVCFSPFRFQSNILF